MSEGLSPAEVGKEIAEHRKHSEHGPHEKRDRWLSLTEAVMLSVVAVLAAWSGFASAKWGTESSVTLSQASAARTMASRSDLTGNQIRTIDSVTFNAWFDAFVAGDKDAMRIAQDRLRPGYRPAFRAWLATDPAHNRDAPPGPAYMPQYKIPQEQLARAQSQRADALAKEGADDGSTSDKYVRTTVFLATVLFLVGISGHFALRSARYALITIASLLLIFSITQLLSLPGPPG